MLNYVMKNVLVYVVGELGLWTILMFAQFLFTGTCGVGIVTVLYAALCMAWNVLIVVASLDAYEK